MNDVVKPIRRRPVNGHISPASTVDPFPGRQLLSPSIANQWLERANARNRNVKHKKVAEYADAMAEGRWVYNGCPISFTRDGSLYDGQTRLHACVRSGVTIETNVVTDVEEPLDSINTANGGAPNTSGDILAMSCGVHKHGGVVASALKWALFLKDDPEEGSALWKKKFTEVKKHQLPALFNDGRQAMVDSVHVIMSNRKLRLMCKPNALFAAMHFLCSQYSPEHASHVFYVLDTGQASLEDPCWHFREWLQQSNPERRTNRDIVARFVRMWRSVISNRNMRVLRSFDGQIPKVW